MKTENYNKNFSLFYDYYLTDLSSDMADHYLKYFNENKITEKRLLDLMCGPGVLINKFKNEGWQVYGLDISRHMLDIAYKNTGLNSERLLNLNIKDINIEEKFSLITCTADGINHIESEDTLKKIFNKVNSILNKGGYFSFDINTILGIINNDYYISVEEKNVFVVRNGITDVENNIGLTKFKGFFMYEGNYRRFDSVIYNYMYKVDDIIRLLEDTGFSNVELFNAENMQEIIRREDDAENFERIVIIAQK
ncbi:class I SAM-dependent DNA methyltransferase [Staphylococcus pseudintermedius]|uniref:class I SAM-dependent DNA methyltransferase n=1 Tax=Staphylococcus pseudintermedius TaxID=283734 RepID=UPI003F65E404